MMIYCEKAKIMSKLIICENTKEIQRLEEVIKHLKFNLLSSFLDKEDFIINHKYTVTFEKVEWDNQRYDEEVYRYIICEKPFAILTPDYQGNYYNGTHYFLFRNKEFYTKSQLKEYFEKFHPFDLIIKVEVEE